MIWELIKRVLAYVVTDPCVASNRDTDPHHTGTFLKSSLLKPPTRQNRTRGQDSEFQDEPNVKLVRLVE